MEVKTYKPEKETVINMRYKSKEESIKDHVDNYKSDGIKKGKGTKLSSDHYRVSFVIENIEDGCYVLDVGCNGGTIAVPLIQHKDCYVRGIDVVPELVELAKSRGVFAKLGEAEDLKDHKDNTYDYVICAEVLEHLYDPMPAIKEAYRVLKPGGKYIVTIPHPVSDMCNNKLGDYHQQNFSPEIIDTMFTTVFKREKVLFYEIPYSKYYCDSLIAGNRLTEEQKKDIRERPQWMALTCEKE